MRSAAALVWLALLPATAGAGGVPLLPAGATMDVERAAHTATRLADGRVLVAGGIRAGEARLASAELYDPQTGEFLPAGSMTSPRVSHTATLLRDGRLLIVGGWGASGQVRTAELYDPPAAASRVLARSRLHALRTRRRSCATAVCWSSVEAV